MLWCRGVGWQRPLKHCGSARPTRSQQGGQWERDSPWGAGGKEEAVWRRDGIGGGVEGGKRRWSRGRSGREPVHTQEWMDGGEPM